jgi:hypothetical protein
MREAVGWVQYEEWVAVIRDSGLGTRDSPAERDTGDQSTVLDACDGGRDDAAAHIGSF